MQIWLGYVRIRVFNPLTNYLQVHGDLSQQMWKIHCADVSSWVSHLRFFQNQRCISCFIEACDVNIGSGLWCLCKTIILAIVSENQPSFTPKLITPLDRESRAVNWRRRVDPEPTVQQNRFSQSRADQSSFTGDTENDFRKERKIGSIVSKESV